MGEKMYIIFKDNKPLRVQLEEKADTCIVLFADISEAKEFVKIFCKNHSIPKKKLSTHPLPTVQELWEYLSTKSEDGKTLQYGILIDFNYKNEPFYYYSAKHLQAIGISGLSKGLELLNNQIREKR